ncbi:uncharacterized protein LOC128202071 isoform X2 [Galleria mellonella]|uniref:Uncharacterized protein LOC128202071 isoform X2 n=1 Tax=Galleria mellonella TaxID=7137 RepID=A0ABM3N0L7_GALME|nr:uncharacterized protein LOC128202071 isoform X2 [Galleria mellonella]
MADCTVVKISSSLTGQCISTCLLVTPKGSWTCSERMALNKERYKANVLGVDHRRDGLTSSKRPHSSLLWNALARRRTEVDGDILRGPQSRRRASPTIHRHCENHDHSAKSVRLKRENKLYEKCI